jgi:hypothetical protein
VIICSSTFFAFGQDNTNKHKPKTYSYERKTKKNIKNMKKNKLTVMPTIVALLGGFALSIPWSASAQSPTITVIPSLAPNVFGSPSYSQWDQNALWALQNGLASYGNPSLPTYYCQAPSFVPISDDIVTGFNSWMGVADPGNVFGSAYANELGNRIQFGVVVNGNGSLISINNLSFSASSTDPGDALGFSFGVGSYNYSSDYIGIIWGAGGQSDVADYTYITSGSSTQLVNEIVGRGSGNALDAYETDPGVNDQARINNAENLGTNVIAFTGDYVYGSSSVSATTELTPAPEPSSVVLGGLGGVALLGMYNRHRLKKMS